MLSIDKFKERMKAELIDTPEQENIYERLKNAKPGETVRLPPTEQQYIHMGFTGTYGHKEY